MGFLLEFLILAVVAVVVFLVTKYVLDQAEADPPIRKLVLLILLLMFLVAIANTLSGGTLFGRVVVLR
jgi:hypothetical protein